MDWEKLNALIAAGVSGDLLQSTYEKMTAQPAPEAAVEETVKDPAFKERQVVAPSTDPDENSRGDMSGQLDNLLGKIDKLLTAIQRQNIVASQIVTTAESPISESDRALLEFANPSTGKPLY